MHEPKYSSTQPSNEFATGAHLSSDIENELGKALLPSSPRTGYLGYEMISAIEPLLYQYGVDLVLTGHEHNYERSYPVYMDKVSIACLSGCVCSILCLSVRTCECQFCERGCLVDANCVWLPNIAHLFLPCYVCAK